MKIPYGNADFADIREKGAFYVDKTPFIPELENDELGYKNLLFLRPRRFGKSLLVSMLGHYYDKSRANRFDELFRGLWVYDHPTPEKSKYLVVKLDFSQTSTRSQELLESSFLVVVRSAVKNFGLRYREQLPDLARFATSLDTFKSAAEVMAELCGVMNAIDEQLYLLIDEYDTFGTALLSDGQESLYAKVTDKAGFVREFYRTLKAGTGSGAIGRIFMTGGTPLLLDDLVSGFNVVTSISMHSKFNALAGFTKADVERAVDELLHDRPELELLPEVQNRQAFLANIETLYDGYRFAKNASERIFNSTMVLHFLRELARDAEYPSQTLDPNARTDYRKLHGLWASAGPTAEERRNVLETVLHEGRIRSDLVEQFGQKTGVTTGQFISLMYYTGMLTLSSEPPDQNQYVFETPNQVIRELSWEHYTRLLEDLDGVKLGDSPVGDALRAMARNGDVDPMLALLRKDVLAALSLKDFPKYNEKSMKMLLMGMILTSGVLHVLSEKEFNQGFNDLFLSPMANLRNAKFAWMLELKYLKEKDRDKLGETIEQAEKQLRQYLADRHLVPMLSRGLELKAGTIVFIGCKEIEFRPLSNV